MGKRAISEINGEQFTPFKRQKLLQSPPSSPEVNGQDFILTKELANNTILQDLMQKQWRIGKPIGKGSFGEIFLASDDIGRVVTLENAKYVAKIEPHSNGPLFVEIHCLLNAGKDCPTQPLPLGMPEYIASGSHHFQSNRYRFLILQRFKCDLHSIIKNCRVNVKHVLTIAMQVLDVLEHLHDKGYAHSDIKAENLMIGSCAFDEMGLHKLNEEQDIMSDDYKGTSRPHRNRRQPIMTDFITCLDKPSRRQLRPHKNVKYNYDDDDAGGVKSDDDADSDYCLAARRRKGGRTSKKKGIKLVDHIYLIDFGLASKFIDSNGEHHPFCMDQRRAHDGTLEFTSRDAHMGAHSRRSDLECLGYNMMLWCLGSLPWKDEKLQSQPEQVHRMKEIFMTDAREMLRLIYGLDVPKFLGEYFHYVNKLAYDERPNYEFLRRMFHREFLNLGYKTSDMFLNLEDLKAHCIELSKTVKSADNHSDKIKNVKAIAKLGLTIPLSEKLNNSRTGSSRISPKNLRSKTDKLPKKGKKRFSWAEILSQDPDQIARQRAEKEFERDQMTETPIKYKGRPTYAILEIEQKLKSKDNNNESRNICQDEDYIKGYTKAMMDVVRRRKASLAVDELSVLKNDKGPVINKSDQKGRRGRRKSDNPTKFRANSKTNKNIGQIHDNFYIRPKTGRKNEALTQQLTPPNTTDESSCSSTNTEVVYGSNKRTNDVKKQLPGKHSKKNGSTGTNSRSSSHSSLLSISSSGSVETYTTSGISSSEFCGDFEDSYDEFRPKKSKLTKRTYGIKQRGRQKGAKTIGKNVNKVSTRT